VVQRRKRLRFAREAGETFVVEGEKLRENLDRDVAIQLRVARAIDLAHAAGAERCHDFIRPESGAD